MSVGTQMYGLLQLSENHSVDEQYVTKDRRGKPIINMDGGNLPWWVVFKEGDIVGFGEDEIGDEAHFLIIPNPKLYPDEIVLDTLQQVQEWFQFDGAP